MTVDQTTHLIHLILNSVMMVTACIIVLGGLLVRYVAVRNRLQRAHQDYLDLLQQVPPQPDRLRIAAARLRHLRRQHHLAHNSVLSIQYALLFFVISVFSLTLRTILNLSWLIPVALILFAGGIIGVLMSVMLTLSDFHAAGHSLRRDVKSLLPKQQKSRDRKQRWSRNKRKRRALIFSPRSRRAAGRSPESPKQSEGSASEQSVAS